MIDAVVSTLAGRVAAQGRITSNSIALKGAYDVEVIELEGDSASVTLGVVNEYLCLEVDRDRKATFPDLIVLLDAGSGMPVAASPAAVGTDVVVVVADRDSIPLGRAVWDRAAYPGGEKLLGMDLAGYL